MGNHLFPEGSGGGRERRHQDRAEVRYRPGRFCVLKCGVSAPSRALPRLDFLGRHQVLHVGNGEFWATGGQRLSGGSKKTRTVMRVFWWKCGGSNSALATIETSSTLLISAELNQNWQVAGFFSDQPTSSSFATSWATRGQDLGEVAGHARPSGGLGRHTHRLTLHVQKSPSEENQA